MKLFTRTDGEITRRTINLFRAEMQREKRTVITFATLIPLGHFLYIVLLPLLISFITQSLIEHPQDIRTPLLLLGGMVIASVVTVIVNQFGFLAMFNHEERVTTRLLKNAVDGLLSHSHTYFSNQKIGSLAGDVNTFSRSYLQLCDAIFLQLGPIFVNFVASLLIIAFIAPILLLPLGALTAFIVIHSLKSLQSRAVHRNRRKELMSKMFGSVADVLGNHTLVRLFGKQRTEVRSLVNERQAIEAVAAKEIDLLQRNAMVRQAVLFTFQIITIALCVVLFSRSMLSIGALIFTITYLGRITGSMFNITNIIRTAEQSFLDASKITQILMTAPDVRDSKNASALRITSSHISFDRVSFAYEDAKDQAVFKDFNLEIPDGQRVGLVGKSGGGKTTFTNLLLRYMDIQEGSIKIDDQDISHVTQASLRNVISYVPQDPYLFHRTLRENIAYGTSEVSDTAVLQAARQAYALEFIERLPHGLDTIVGERGVKLSGGQRQRIAVARAILKDAPILLLDEATSALDSESERYIQDALATLMKGRTSIVVAHRLSTIAKLDRILVLDNGHIVEDGTHAELLKADGIYANLWAHQSGGFIDD